jgi:glucose-1-phosphate thymidylyltransferase
MKAIIPTGGRGTRMRPLTFSSNKHFIPVANKPLVFYPIETVVDAGITEIAITYNPGYLDEVKSYLGDGSRWGATFTYVLQEKPIGLANIVEVCEDFIGDDQFVFHLGDNIFTDGIKDLVNYFQTEKPDGLVAMVHHSENIRLGVPYFDENGRLMQYVEKPENPPHDYAVPGIYFLDSKAFKAFKGEDRIQPSARGEYEIPSVFQWLIDHKFRVDVREYAGKWLDPGKFNDWIESNQYILDNKKDFVIDSEPDEGSTIENRVSIGKNCVITNSHIRGPVVIADNVTIQDSYVGPFTSVDSGCAITKSHVENSVIMSKVTITNVAHPIDSSLIGTASEVTHSETPSGAIRLFVGEMCQISV